MVMVVVEGVSNLLSCHPLSESSSEVRRLFQPLTQRQIHALELKRELAASDGVEYLCSALYFHQPSGRMFESVFLSPGIVLVSCFAR